MSMRLSAIVWQSLLLSLALMGAAEVVGARSDPTAAEAEDPALRNFGRKVDRALALSEANEHAAADSALAEVLAQPLLFRLSEARQHGVFSAATWTALNLDDAARGRVLAAKAIAIDPDHLHDWLWLSHAEAMLGDHDAAATKLARALRRQPGWLASIDADEIAQRVFHAETGSPGRRSLLDVLFDLDWNPHGLGASTFWYLHALEQVLAGDQGAASRTMARVDTPIEILKLRIDRRFDGLVEREAPQFDVAAAAARDVARLRGIVRERPRSLRALNDLLAALLVAGLHDDASSLSARAVRALDQKSTWQTPFDDADQANWLRDLRAGALIRSGHHQAALDEMNLGRTLREQGVTNTSQTLNFAHLAIAFGRFEEARAALDEVGGMSPFGQMVLARARQRIGLLDDDASAAEAALDYLVEHQADAPMAHVQGLAEAGRSEAAAEALVAMLDSPERRIDALFELQTLRRPDPLPTERAFRAQWDALVARPDVQEAVRRVGRIESAPIYGY